MQQEGLVLNDIFPVVTLLSFGVQKGKVIVLVGSL